MSLVTILVNIVMPQMPKKEKSTTVKRACQKVTAHQQ